MKYLNIHIVLSLIALVSCGLLGGGGDDSPDIPGRMVFSAKDDKGASQIFTMNADGSGLRQLTGFGPDGGAADPAWSPDGTKIAYQVCTNCELGGGNYEISVVEVAGEAYDPGQVHAVTGHPAGDTHPAWSPDGQRIVFASNRAYTEADSMRYRTDLYVMNADGTNLQRLTEMGNATRPAWSPDGITIAYEWNRHGNMLYLYNMATNQITNTDSGLQFAGNPMWNKDGTKLLIGGRKTEEERPELRLLNMEAAPPEILQTVTLNKDAIGRDYDWYNVNKK